MVEFRRNSRIFRCNKRHYKKLDKKTDIPAHKIGRLWKFKFSEVDEWVKSGNAAL